ncbi:MAG: hypothetical protein ACXVXG_17415 [Nocardioidaceae bacterium]
MSGRSAHDVLDSQRAIHLQRMRELTAARRTANEADLLAITYELAHLDPALHGVDLEAAPRVRPDRIRAE